MFEDQEFAPLTETEREVIEAAVNHFSEEDFQTSAEILANIVANRPNDFRFKHNLAVAEFRQRACCGWAEFLDELNKAFSEARLTPNPDSMCQENVEYPVLWFNLAVLFFHQKKFRRAFIILEKLSKTFSNVTTPLTTRAKLLLIDVLIKLQQYERALNEIELFESLLRPSSVDITSQSSPKTEEAPKMIPMENAKFENESKIRLQQYKTQCHLFMKSLKFGKKECKQLFLATGPNHPTAYIGTCLKAYHDYLRGNMKKSHKSISNVKQSNSEGDFNEQALMKYGDLLNVICRNNAACCDFYSGRPSIAAMSFQKAAQEYDKYTKRDSVKLPLYASQQNMKMELVYNFGVTLLNLKRPSEAFQYLNLCLNTYYNNPRLWLRVAECCIQVHKSDNSHHLNMEQRDFIRECRGSDSYKKLVIAEPRKIYEIKDRQEIMNDHEKPSLEYASICLENALRLVESDSIANEGCLYVRPSTPIFNIQEINCLHAAILCAAAYVQLQLENYPLAIKRCHQLMSLQNIPGAYQYLGKMYMGEAYFKYGQLDKTMHALFQENSCDVNFFVAQDVEDRKDDGELESSWPGHGSVGVTGAVKPINEWYPNNEFTARAILVYNQAVASASAGELDKASEVLRGWISRNENRTLAPEFIQLAAYLHVRLGNTPKAKSLLKSSSKQ